MNDFLQNLEPQTVWSQFREILAIPRPSKKEEKIIAYLEAFGKKHQLETLRDAIGNVLIRKGATKGFENKQTIVLQSHIDMVCEKNSDINHNFDRDPIEAQLIDGWVKAKGTTLGADDGIGVAAQLALLAANDIEHGPIECLFTVDEETGLTGAFELDKDLLKGRILLNLDSEDEGELFIGCAGGKGTTAKLFFQKEKAPADHLVYNMQVSGLKGGHSGDDIHRGLGNANKILNRMLWMATREFDMRLNHMQGGNLHNAIAREAKAICCIPAKLQMDFEQAIEALATQIKNEFKLIEPTLQIEWLLGNTAADVVDTSAQNKLLNSLYACPHGVLAMSQSIPGFVETSTNLASVRQNDDHWFIATSQRSSVASALTDAAQMVAAPFLLAGAKVEHGDGYPGWEPNPNSVIREVTEKAYTKLFGKQPEVKAIHAGLECGLIGDKYPGMDMISYGPTIKGAHSPDERIQVETVAKFWELTLEVLRNGPEN
jgi:dipeptidase D